MDDIKDRIYEYLQNEGPSTMREIAMGAGITDKEFWEAFELLEQDGLTTAEIHYRIRGESDPAPPQKWEKQEFPDPIPMEELDTIRKQHETKKKMDIHFEKRKSPRSSHFIPGTGSESGIIKPTVLGTPPTAEEAANIDPKKYKIEGFENE